MLQAHWNGSEDPEIAKWAETNLKDPDSLISRAFGELVGNK